MAFFSLPSGLKKHGEYSDDTAGIHSLKKALNKVFEFPRESAIVSRKSVELCVALCASIQTGML